MADLDAMMSELRALNEPVPKPVRLPSEQEVKTIEDSTGVLFPPDFRRYLLEASDVVFGTLEPVTVDNPDAHTHFTNGLDLARAYEVPRDLIPICRDNADFYCVTQSGEVVFWDHNGTADERWETIASWIEQVWIGESG